MPARSGDNFDRRWQWQRIDTFRFDSQSQWSSWKRFHHFEGRKRWCESSIAIAQTFDWQCRLWSRRWWRRIHVCLANRNGSLEKPNVRSRKFDATRLACRRTSTATTAPDVSLATSTSSTEFAVTSTVDWSWSHYTTLHDRQLRGSAKSRYHSSAGHR